MFKTVFYPSVSRCTYIVYLFYEEIVDSTMKVLDNYIKKYLPQLIRPAQYGFIVGRSILHYLLSALMPMDYARHTHDELILSVLDQLYLVF